MPTKSEKNLRSAGKEKGKAGAVDWGLVRAKVAAAARDLENMEKPDTEDARRILKERARLLALKPSSANAKEKYVEVVTFQLSGESYAIESRYVTEVTSMKQLTPLPGTPRFVLGIMNLRGDIISVVDIGKLFDLPERGLTDTDRILVVDDGKMKFGLLASGVTVISNLRLESIEASLTTLTGIRGDLLRGVTPDGVALLDGARLLADDRVVVRDRTRD